MATAGGAGRRRACARLPWPGGAWRRWPGIAPALRCAAEDAWPSAQANCPEYLEALHAIYWCGAVSVPSTTSYARLARNWATAARAWSIVGRAARCSVCRRHDPLARQVLGGPVNQAAQGAPLAWRTTPEDLASLFYTSGTTGRCWA